MRKFSHIFWGWLPIGVTIVLLCGFVYATVQQNYRRSLNDPQIQMVIDAKNALLSGKQPQDIVPKTPTFDIEKSLSPFLAVYDESGNPLQSNATLGGELPRPPVGVFEYAKAHGEDRVTWQPNSNTRIALVVMKVDSKPVLFVASGRNMSEVESRIHDLGTMTCLALFASLIASFVAYAFAYYFRTKISS